MKVPCGGFDLDESVFNVDKNSKQIKLNSPISYDYMPEGYPSKDIEYVTLMEEQEVAFTEHGGLMGANSPVDLEIKLGDKLTVVWDGVSYNVTVKAQEMGPGEALIFGNLGLIGVGDAEDYPFVYVMVGSQAQWVTADTATSHTIKVMRPIVKYTPIDANYMPEGYPKKNVKIDTFEEQEVAFADGDGVMAAEASIGFEIVQGDKLTVVWDGANYDVIVEKITAGPKEYLAFGNLGLVGDGEETDYPFLYENGWWFTADTAASHTIGVTRQQVIYTTMDANFMPKNLNVLFAGNENSIPTSCNITYEELRSWAESGVPIFAIYKFYGNGTSGTLVSAIITSYEVLTNSLLFYYQVSTGENSFKYDSNGISKNVG